MTIHLIAILCYYSDVEKQFEKFMQFRTERAAVSYELEKEKHVLRQMQGQFYCVLNFVF